MPERYDLIVFDWDGTLMDSAAEIVGAMTQAIQDIGLPERSPEQMRELIGLGMDDVLARLFPELDTARVRGLLQAYRNRYGAPGSSASLFPGVRDALDRLRAARYELAVATGKSRAGLDRAMAQVDLSGHFAHSRCADESTPKPAPDMLEDILLRAATPPERALMVGDTEYDMAMARAAGVDSLGVAWGVHDGGRLLEAGALAVLPDVPAIHKWLAKNPR